MSDYSLASLGSIQDPAYVPSQESSDDDSEDDCLDEEAGGCSWLESGEEAGQLCENAVGAVDDSVQHSDQPASFCLLLPGVSSLFQDF